MAENIKVIKECNDISYDEAMERLHDRVAEGLVPEDVASSYEDKISDLYARTKLKSPKCAEKGIRNILSNWWRVRGIKYSNYDSVGIFKRIITDYTEEFSYVGNYNGHKRVYTLTDAFGPEVEILDNTINAFKELHRGLQLDFDNMKKVSAYCKNSNIDISDMARER